MVTGEAGIRRKASNAMSMWQRRAVIWMVIWAVATVGFLVAGFVGKGPAGLAQDTPRRDLAAGFVAGGIVLSMAVRFVTRRRAGVTVDERDEAINGKSSEIALGLTAAGVFVGCIALNEAYHAAGAVPVNWVWFLAFSSMVVAHLAQAVGAVILYSGVFDRAEG